MLVVAICMIQAIGYGAVAVGLHSRRELFLESAKDGASATAAEIGPTVFGAMAAVNLVAAISFLLTKV